ncbi:hypothetical protein GCM10023317_84890 [Actinopolymorpha pittospori]
MNVLTAAWIGTGAPPATSTTTGTCARCAAFGDLVPARLRISKQFTGFDGWANSAGRGLCQACAWAYSTPALRSVPHLVTRDPATMQQLARGEADVLLRSGALGSDLALVVPLRPGRKHILPTACWGRVSIDDAQLPWSDQDAERLRVLVTLRGLGFGSRMLEEPAPPFRVMKTLRPAQWSWALQGWEQLAFWRAPDNPWLPLALHVTTPTAKGAR